MNMHAQLPEITERTAFAAPSRGRRWWLVVLALAVAAVIGGYYWYSSQAAAAKAGAAAAAAAAEIPAVTVVVPTRQPVADVVRVTGSIAARRDMPVGIQGEGGMVTAVLVDAGQTVSRGQVLARIDHAVQTQQVASMAAAIRSAKADAALAQAELERAAKLVDKGFISKADIDRKTAARDGGLAKVAVAQAQLGEMQARLQRLDVRAPASGLVLTRTVEAGQVVSPANASLFRIAEGGVLELRALVAEQDIARLKVGQSANVRPIGSGTDYPGRIWLIDPVIDNTSRQGVARVALAYAPGLRVGAFANATIAAGEAFQPVLPQSAVQVDDTGSFVYIVAPGNLVQRRSVTVGQVTAAGLSITSGLQGSERVVATAAAFLRPGEKIKPQLAKSPAI